MTTEYDIITATCASTLARRVKDTIAEGWQPLGGAGCSENPRTGERFFIQAVVKTDEPTGQ